MKWLPWILAGGVAVGLFVLWWHLTKNGVKAGARQMTTVLTDPSGAMRETTMATSRVGNYVVFGPDGLPLGT